MPSQLPKPCYYPGCPGLTHDRYCSKHKKEGRQRDEGERGKTAERGYGSRWQRYSKNYLSENPLCVECLKKRRTMPSIVTDHVIPVNAGGSMWNPDNHQALCKCCHDKKTRTEDQKKIIY